VSANVEVHNRASVKFRLPGRYFPRPTANDRFPGRNEGLPRASDRRPGRPISFDPVRPMAMFASDKWSKANRTTEQRMTQVVERMALGGGAVGDKDNNCSYHQ